MVRDDSLGKTMMVKDVIQKQMSELRSIHSFASGNEMSNTHHSVANNPNGVIAMRRWEFDNEIHGY